MNFISAIKLFVRWIWPRPEQALLRTLRRGRLDSGRSTFLLPDGRSVEGMKGLEAYNEYKDIFINGIYQFTPCRSNPRILDAGGYIGFSALYFLGKYPESQLSIFECDPEILKILKRNLAQNNHQSPEIVEAALAAKDGEATFYRSGDDAGSLFQKTEESFQVKCVSLRPWLEQGEVDFLKLNIEGAEMDVLASCEDLLPRVREMVIEFHSFAGQEQRLDELLSTLRRANFRYLLNHFDYESNLAVRPPFQLKMDLSFVLLVYAQRMDLLI